MKTLLLLTIIAYFHASHALMTINEFRESGLLKCYDTNAQDSRRISLRNINGQTLPLPNSIETFVSLVERYESYHTTYSTFEVVGKFLKYFRLDDLTPNIEDDGLKLKDPTESSLKNSIKRAIFSIPEKVTNDLDEDDFTDDEKCALHFMLSHTVNDTRVDQNDVAFEDTNKAKRPREIGVVSLHSKKKHAFALGRVLLGIYAGFLEGDDELLTAVMQRAKTSGGSSIPDSVRNVRVNVVDAVTIGDLVSRLMTEDEITLLPNGEWTDTSCPTEYRLDDNNKKGFITYSELRGAVDGFLIGRKIQEVRDEFRKFRLSQILRQYYGSTGMIDKDRARWCIRERLFQPSTFNLDEQMLNFNRLYAAMSYGGEPGKNAPDKIQNVITEIRNNIFKDIEMDECKMSEQSIERKYVNPRNIFAILDYTSAGQTKLSFQADVIGNLSSDFDLRPRGNLIGVYSNLKPLQANTLDVIAKNSGISGCASCFARHYAKGGNKQDEEALFRDLNGTLTAFEAEYEELENKYQSEKAGSPGKVLLYFNFGTSNYDQKTRDALWDLERYFRGLTIIVISDNRDALKYLVENDQTDMYSSNGKTVQEIKQRIRQVPGEFTFKECARSSKSAESANKQEAFIPPNKIQYWAMYPQYFLKSFSFKLKFKAQEGTSIRVCFSRSYSIIVEGKGENCKDSTGNEIEFYDSNPCKKRNVHNCDPFYFSVEGKKPPTAYCTSLRCSTPHDIQFEFEHEGLSCNKASFLSVSVLALLFAAVMYHLQRQ